MCVEQRGTRQVYGEPGSKCSRDPDPNNQSQQALHETRQIPNPAAGARETRGGTR